MDLFCWCLFYFKTKWEIRCERYQFEALLYGCICVFVVPVRSREYYCSLRVSVSASWSLLHLFLTRFKSFQQKWHGEDKDDDSSFRAWIRLLCFEIWSTNLIKLFQQMFACVSVSFNTSSNFFFLAREKGLVLRKAKEKLATRGNSTL